MPRRRTAPLTASPLSLALSLTLAAVLTACGGTAEEHPDGHSDSSSSASESPSAPESSESESATETATETPEDTGTRIEIERSGDAISPNGERVEAPVGEPITLVITSDAPGELHVHSTPEQEITYGAGTSEHEVTIDRPGIVEVESHEPHLVVLQLEVR